MFAEQFKTLNYRFLELIPLQVLFGFCVLQHSIVTSANGTIRITPTPESRSAGLDVSHALIPGEILEFRACETILDGNHDYGLFQIELGSTSEQGRSAWWGDKGKLGFAWEYTPGIGVEFKAEIVDDQVELTYTVANRTSNPLSRVHLHTCVVTTRSQSFYARKAVSPAVKTSNSRQPAKHSELYQRLWMWSGGKKFSFASLALSPHEPHIAVMRQNEKPIQWAWWTNDRQTFDKPLIMLQSHCNEIATALWFENAIWASANTGDDRACFHLFPYFGAIESGQEATVKGAFLVKKCSLEEAKTLLLAPKELE